MSQRFLAAVLAASALCAASPARAHVTLEVQQAAPNSYYRATFRVPHGCDGAPTIRFTVRVPEGVTVAQPMPKPGWTLRTVARGEAGAGHGASAPLAEIIWEGGSLDSAHYDEFVVRLRLPNTPGELLYIPVVQDCPGGAQAAWTEIPQPGRRITDYRHPAPALRLAPRN
ncbi:YcnI family protein [Falsiroseomonas selenitidurans]|uniref:YcnI family protein n=1 Tax=Falsiroseomonas selenitidurans TaxID=2716335 RepID=A0ABX1EC47_9PROT|nr:YcnI family protein [Falsiroseomonas selenitidurans]NKC34423.1 YcnI family protein [Falsiroseomonas selenitidurans]